uniref:G_PROTEIN_RECEP_F1_2 domain-containing protein n=1 Tax=Angiostrongylus cantonensis TaxID=6313 RepID=A0A0K0D0L6_ANGCA
MAHDFQPITSSDQIEKLPLTQSVLLINGIFGTLAILPNLLLFVILISPGKRYGRDNVLLIASCLSDIISCVALSLTGFTRYSLVSLALKEHAIPVVTQWSCVAYAFVSIRLIGNVMAPLTQIANAIERYICIRHPLRYRQQFITRQIIAVSIVLSATTVAIVTATAVAYVNGNKPTNFLCGRREAYGSTFAIFLYGLLVGGYLTAFLIGLFSYIFVVKNRGG